MVTSKAPTARAKVQDDWDLLHLFHFLEELDDMFRQVQFASDYRGFGEVRIARRLPFRTNAIKTARVFGVPPLRTKGYPNVADRKVGREASGKPLMMSIHGVEGERHPRKSLVEGIRLRRDTANEIQQKNSVQPQH